MVSRKIIAILAASSALALFTASAVNAESIVKEEQEQLSNDPAPDVDPGASKGADKPIIEQERMQLGNSPGPNVPEGPKANKKGGDSIPAEEQKDIGN